MYQPKRVTQIDVGILKCIFVCPFCKNEYAVIVSERSFNDYYYNGKLAQNAFPDMSIDDRELFISGVCKECF